MRTRSNPLHAPLVAASSLALALALKSASLSAQDVPASLGLAASSGTNDVYLSDEFYQPPRRRDVILERLDTNGVYSLRDRRGAFASLAALMAEQVAASNAHAVAAAWTRGFSNGVEQLRAAFANAPTSGIFLGLDFPLDPAPTRAALDIYVVSNAYDGASDLDLLWIYFSRTIAKPTIEVPYIVAGETNRVLGSWTLAGTQAHWTNTYDIVRGEYAYPSCHLLFVQRPAALHDAPINLNPHGLFGRAGSGIAWGQVQTTYLGRPSLSGIITDGTNNYEFLNGFLLTTTPTETTP